MIKSIQLLEAFGIKNSEKEVINFWKDPKDIAAFIYGIRDEVIHLGLEIIKETLEDCNQILGMESRERITEDAYAKLLTEAVQSSYRRAGEETSLTDEVSKQTVKNKLHALQFPDQTGEPKEKKIVEYLYIDADEDQVALQFKEKG